MSSSPRPLPISSSTESFSVCFLFSEMGPGIPTSQGCGEEWVTCHIKTTKRTPLLPALRCIVVIVNMPVSCATDFHCCWIVILESNKRDKQIWKCILRMRTLNIEKVKWVWWDENELSCSAGIKKQKRRQSSESPVGQTRKEPERETLKGSVSKGPTE